MMSRSPLCPPSDPCTRARNRPSGRFTSSVMTSKSGTSSLKYRSSPPTARPLRFTKVTGLASKVPPSPRFLTFAISASAGDASNEAPCRRAISSTTLKPTLCRVLSYSRPGLPRPTISFKNQSSIPDPQSPSLLLLFLGRRGWFLAFGVFLLALLDDFGFRRRGRCRRCRRLRRHRHFFNLRDDDVPQHHVRVADRLPLRGGRHVADADALAHHHLGNIHLDVLRNIGGHALDF